MQIKSWIVPILLMTCGMQLVAQGTLLYDTQFDQQIKLADCISQLEQNFALAFSYPAEIGEQQISVPPLQSTPSLETYLNQLFLSIGFEYQIVDEEKILLRPKLTKEEQSPQGWTWQSKIIDSNTKEEVMYALVQTEDQTAFVYSDELGEFQLSLKPSHSDAKIIVHAIGYKDQYFQPSQGVLPKVIILEPTDLLLSEITILEPKQSPILSGSNLEQRGYSDAYLSKVGGIYEQDIFREIQMATAGISAVDDGDAGLRIRGGNPDETLIVLDDIPIYKADHFYGIFSAINSDYVKTYEVYKNANPIQYGGKLSGMVDLHSEDEVNKTNGKISMDLLSTDAVLHIPVQDNIGLLMGARGSYTNLTKNKSFDLSDQNQETIGNNGTSRDQVIESNPDFDFFDGNGKLFFDFDKIYVEANFYGSHDLYNNNYLSEFKFGSSLNLFGGTEQFEQEQLWKNIGSSIKLAFGKKKWKTSIIGHQTRYSTSNDILAGISLRRPAGDKNASYTLNTNNAVQDIGVKTQVSYEHKEHTASMGLDYIQHQSELQIFPNGVSAFDRKIDGRELTGFGSWDWRPNKDWHFQVGNRLTYFKSNFYALPQLQLKYLGRNTMAKASISRKAQFVREVTFNDRLGQTNQYLLTSEAKSLPVGLSWNYMLGGALYFSKFTLDVELYLKNTSGVLAFRSGRLGINDGDVVTMTTNDFRVFRGNGRNTGLDLALQFNDKNYQGSITYTLSKSLNQFSAIYRNQWFASPNDSRHQFNFVHNYSWRKFNFFGSYIYASGRPYNDISNLGSATLISDIDPDDLIQRLPDYHRLDLGFNYTIPISNTKLSLGLSCFNLTNHANVKYLQYIYAVPSDGLIGKSAVAGTEALQLDRTWNLNLSFEF